MIPVGNLEGDLKRATLAGSTLAFVAVFGLWGSTNWAPTLVHELPEFHGAEPATLTKAVSYAIMALNAGDFRVSQLRSLADRFGRRPVFAFMHRRVWSCCLRHTCFHRTMPAC